MMFLLILAFLQEMDLAPYLSAEPERVARTSGGNEESFDLKAGLLLQRRVLPDGDTLDYERPVVLLPTHLAVGESHESQRRFVRRSNGAKKDVGSHNFQARILRIEDCPGFDDCLVVSRSEVRMDFSGSQERVSLTEWYARGEGLVRAEGEREVRSADGTTARREPVRFQR